MNTLNLKKLGEHQIIIPTSLATCLDFVMIWGGQPNKAQLCRLCAAAIAVGVDHAKVLPSYPVNTGDPVQFGHKILDRLLEAGVTPSQVYTMGTEVLAEMIKAIPTEDDVEETANFS